MNYSTHFTDYHRRQMHDAREEIHRILRPFVDTLADRYPSFEGFVLFSEDSYHRTAGAISQFNRTDLTPARRKFQDTNITNRRVDLETTALGEMFQLAEHSRDIMPSRMNPEHLVAGLYLPPQSQLPIASVFQMAFTRELHSNHIAIPDIYDPWKRLERQLIKPLSLLSETARIYPNQSISDALHLDVPTTPNAFVFAWDTSSSRHHAHDNYAQLRDFLTITGHAIKYYVESNGGHLMRPTGDGQAYYLPIPYPQVNRNDPEAVGQFGIESFVPLLQGVVSILHNHIAIHPSYAARVTASVGCVELTTFDHSSPEMWAMADLDARMSRQGISVAMTPHTIAILQQANPKFMIKNGILSL